MIVVATQQRTQVSTRRLLEAAVQLIAEQGYERTTLAAIGQRAGYSRGLVTQRFGSKDGLLHALVHRLTTEWAIHHLDPQVTREAPLDSITLMLTEIRDSVASDQATIRALYALMFEGIRIPALYADMVELHNSIRRRVADAVHAGRELGEVPAHLDGEAFARLVVSALRGASYQWLLDPQFPIVQTITDLVALVRRELTIPPAPTPAS